jgi:hypothetical protein
MTILLPSALLTAEKARPCACQIFERVASANVIVLCEGAPYFPQWEQVPSGLASLRSVPILENNKLRPEGPHDVSSVNYQ